MKRHLSYLAGYIDGDGCFYVFYQPTVDRYRAQIVISSTNRQVLEHFLLKILPYIRAKKPVCEKLIEFYNTTLPNGGDRQSDAFKASYAEILTKREIMVEEIHKLNSKGRI